MDRRDDAHMGTGAPSVGGATMPSSAGGVLHLVLPRQHGAWSILLVGYLIGTLAMTGSRGAIPWLALGALVCGFVARHALAQALALRRKALRWAAVALWGLFLAGTATAATGALVLLWDRWGLLLIGGLAGMAALAALAIERLHRDRTAWGEIVGVLGLSAAIPFAAYARSGELDAALLGLWLLGALYLTGPVFHVRFLVRNWRARQGTFAGRLRAGWASVAYHIGALGAATALTLLGWTPAWAVCSLLPGTAKALGTLRRGGDSPPVVRSVGLVELAHSVVFGALLVLAYRRG